MAYSGSMQLLQKNPGESSVPVLVSSGGYGIFWDNPSVTTVDLTKRARLHVRGRRARRLLLHGGRRRRRRRVLPRAHRASAAVRPLGLRLLAEQGPLRLAERAARRRVDVPLDADPDRRHRPGLDSTGARTPGARTSSTRATPTRPAMFKTLHDTGFHAMISVWARFASGSANYDALKAAGDFITPPMSDGSTMYYDPFKADARSLYWQQMNTALFTKGVDGWWLDATEPELDGNWGQFRTSQTSLGPGAVVYNAFPLMTTTAVHDGQRAATSDKRVFILTRSAYAGQQRNGAVTWSGDITGDWATFKKQIPAGLNFSLSGHSLLDDRHGRLLPRAPGRCRLGGVHGAVRAVARSSATFCPIFRTHGTGSGSQPLRVRRRGATVLRRHRHAAVPAPAVHLFAVVEVTHDGVHADARARVRLRRRSAGARHARRVHVRPAFLVSPVSDAGATSRSVYLPAGTTWIDFWSGASTAGGQTVTARGAHRSHLPSSCGPARSCRSAPSSSTRPRSRRIRSSCASTAAPTARSRSTRTRTTTTTTSSGTFATIPITLERRHARR